MKVLVVGQGAREHAITKKLAEEDVELHVAMARMNPGIANLAKSTEILDINVADNYERFNEIDLAFIGPEAPLAAGIVDYLNERGIPVVGPTRAQARLEWSKAFTRFFLQEHGIQGNPEFSICRDLKSVRSFLKDNENVVVKPDPLTGGKGVKLMGEHLNSSLEVENYASERIRTDGLVVLEEKLTGKEFTLQSFTDGNRVEVMPLVRDYKRALDGDKGPNTGSMGSFSCSDHSLPDLPRKAVQKGEEIMRKTIREISKSVGKFKGILYGGFMNTAEGVYLLEYNARFGDPEAINVLALLETPLLEVGWSIIDGRLDTPKFQKKATVCVYLVPTGYPTSPKKGSQIFIDMPIDSEIYYASIYSEDGGIYTTTSRSIALLAKGETVGEARCKVYKDVPNIRGELFYRKDIATEV